MIRFMIRPRLRISWTRLARNNSSVPDKPLNPPEKHAYIPQSSYQRVSYEYPPPPGQAPYKPVESRPFRRHLPVAAGVAGLLWALYAYYYFVSERPGSEQEHLAQTTFTTFKITHRENLTDNLALIELSPKFETFRKMMRSSGSGLWNGHKLWSIEVKQPEIQIVRNFTPLPVRFEQYREGGESKTLLRMLGTDADEGKFVLLVKRYQDSEVSRYLHELPLFSEVDIRGPFVDYQFPYKRLDSVAPPRPPMQDLPSRMEPEYLPKEAQGLPGPDNIAFFAAGTGISAVLQPLLSRNPPRGMVHAHVSVRSRSEIPFPRFLLFLEKAGRAKFRFYVDDEKSFIGLDDIPEPKNEPAPSIASNSVLDEREQKLQEIMADIRRRKADKAPEPDAVKDTSKRYRSLLEQVADRGPDEPPNLAVVCGPEGYVRYLTGERGAHNDQPIAGLLGQKGWTRDNTFRMEN